MALRTSLLADLAGYWDGSFQAAAADRFFEVHDPASGELLARLPDNGILINTGRGAIVDQEALHQDAEPENRTG